MQEKSSGWVSTPEKFEMTAVLFIFKIASLSVTVCDYDSNVLGQ